VTNKQEENENKRLREKYGIFCKICGGRFLRISNTHLEQHALTCKEYKELYGKNSLTSEYLKKQCKKVAKEKYSERMKVNNPMFNPKWYAKMVKTRTSEESHEKHKQAMIESWQDPTKYIYHTENLRKAISEKDGEYQKKPILPNEPEAKLIGLFFNYNLSYQYVGDGRFFVNGKNPDFINKEKKKIIELFGTYWHSEERTGLSNEEHEQKRINIFAEHDYDVLVIWEHELEDMDKVLEKVKEFDKMETIKKEQTFKY